MKKLKELKKRLDLIIKLNSTIKQAKTWIRVSKIVDKSFDDAIEYYEKQLTKLTNKE
jgi:hypothetical protein